MKKFVFGIFILFFGGVCSSCANNDQISNDSVYLQITDSGEIIRFGSALDGCDGKGAREASVVEDSGVFYLFYDGQSDKGWRVCLAVSEDLISWQSKGVVLAKGDTGEPDSGAATSPWFIEDNNEWHMFYLGTPNVTKDNNLIPVFPYYTLEAVSSGSLHGPWLKKTNHRPFVPKPGTFYSSTASPGFMVKQGEEFWQFFSGSSLDNNGKILRSLGIAKTKDLNTVWEVGDMPILPPDEQIENSSLYYDANQNIWFLFTNHVGSDAEGHEYTDAIWVYWSKDLSHWDVKNKAVVLDETNSMQAKGAIGMPSVIKVDQRLAVFYDATFSESIDHMGRSIGLLWIDLPIRQGR